MPTDFYPTFRYAPQCPEGRKFTDRATFDALGPEWVDSPALLPPVAVPDPASAPDDLAGPGPVMKRGRPRKDDA